MPGRVTQIDSDQIVADLLRARNRQARALVEVQVPQPAKDTLTIGSNGNPATWQLTAIPYQGTGGSSLNLSLNGVELLEGVDYTVDYTTAIVTFSAGQQALFKATPTPADVLTADYWTTGDLIAASAPADTGPAAFVAANTATSSVLVTSIAVTVPSSAQVGHLLVLAGSMASAQAFTTPAGWTLAAQNTSDGISRLNAWYRICQAGDPGSTVTLTISGGGSELPAAACLAYSGISNSAPLYSALTPFDASSTTSWGNGALDLTVAPTDSMCVLIWGSDPTGALPTTMDAALTGRVSISSNSNRRALAVGDELLAPGGVEATRHLTVSTPNPFVGIALAFREP